MQIRRVSESEVDVCLELFLRATNDLEVKRGDSPIAPEDVMWLPASIKHLLSTDPERALFAVKDDEPVGLGAAYQREDFWFLSYLEILPEHQGIGVGRAILESLLPTAGVRTTMTLATVVEARQPVSTMLYARYGIVPRTPLYWLDGLSRLTELPELPQDVEAHALSSNEHQEAIDVLDRDLLGYARPQDHAMWARVADDAKVYLDEDGLLVGYGYVTEDSWMAPALGTDENLVAAIVRDLLTEGFAGHLSEVTIPVLGHAATMLPAFLRAGARSDEGGAKLLYCSSRRALPPQYLFYSGFLP